jgi:hypothetical protein
MKAQVHQEYPMFSKQTTCGKKLTKRMYYVWGATHLITCEACLKARRKEPWLS